MNRLKRPTIAEINLEALRYNFSQIRNCVSKNVKIMAVVKANAYGHGAVMISRELEKCGVNFLGVATCEEGIELRKAHIHLPILVLGGIFKGQSYWVKRYNLTPVIYNLEAAEELSRYAEKSNYTFQVQVKVDTGMGRIGILPTETTSFFTKLSKLPRLKIQGILTHLADNTRDNLASRLFTQRQAKIFTQQIEQLRKTGLIIPYQHLANSAAIVDKNPACFNLVRPGIMLYGVYPAKRFRKLIELKPVMKLKTKIVSLKWVPKGTTISYGRTFTCQRESLIATVPIGYADGFSRFLSNRGEVLVRGKRAPIAGVVCMDMTMVDVTAIPGATLYDEVVLIGTQGNECISVEEVAEKIGTIPYEVLCGISSRVPRVYSGVKTVN